MNAPLKTSECYQYSKETVKQTNNLKGFQMIPDDMRDLVEFKKWRAAEQTARALQEQNELLKTQNKGGSQAVAVAYCPHCGGGLPKIGVSVCMHCRHKLVYRNADISGFF